MSRDQVMSMLRKQVAVDGGCGDGMPCMGGSGGLFSSRSKAGLGAYQAFRAANPGLSRAELSVAWHRHKMGGMMTAGALVGGYPGQRVDFAAVNEQYPPGEMYYKANRTAAKKQLRAAYLQAHPGWAPPVRSARAQAYSRLPKAAKEAYKEARRNAAASGMCPPFVGATSAAELHAISERLRTMAMEHQAAELLG